ncbi:MAG: non-canonical purine NTP diphosphatase [Bacteroidia bacterium]|nr:non-canonical purine NTP diphosphatase [Bacteroidia bacterium]
MQLVFASNNQHKLSEIQFIIGKEFQLITLSEAGFTGDIPEDQNTLEGNALEKARYIFSKLGVNCFADDTGLEVEALNGEPGVYSARYAGHTNNSENNIAKLLLNIKNKTNRKAQFRTVIALIINGKEFLFEGIVKGIIIKEKRGSIGFGYDPIFVPDGYNNTFAEMPINEKNKISHRANAIHKLADFLKKDNLIP